MSSSKAKKAKAAKKNAGKPKKKGSAHAVHKEPRAVAAASEQPAEGEPDSETQPEDVEALASEAGEESAAEQALGADNDAIHAVGEQGDEAATDADAPADTDTPAGEQQQASATDEEASDEVTAQGDEDDAALAPQGPSAPVVELPRADQRRLVESLVFVSDRAISAQQLGRMLKIKMALAKELAEELMVEYQGRGIELVELSGGYQFRSAAASAHVVREHIAQPPVRLTRAQLETLALVAYRQPITRPEIDDVRGVDSGSALRVLLERGLLKMLGRKDEPGRPLLYGTTPFFLDFFGMRSLKDLPTLREFTELSDENRALFKRKTGETIEEAEAALLAAEEAAVSESVASDADAIEEPSSEGDHDASGDKEREQAEVPAEASADDVPTPEDEELAERDLEAAAETFAAGSLQTSPDNGDDGVEAQARDDEEHELPPAPEA